MPAEWVERLRERDEVAGNQPRPLMDQLIEGMLAIRSRFSPVDRAGIGLNGFAGQRDMFAVAFHRQLLKVRRESLEVLVVRENGHGLRAEKVVVPDAQQTQDD